MDDSPPPFKQRRESSFGLVAASAVAFGVICGYLAFLYARYSWEGQVAQPKAIGVVVGLVAGSISLGRWLRRAE